MIKELSFNREVAVAVGVEKAILVHYLAFCIEKNKSNEVNFHKGKYWTNNTHESLLKVFPFFNNRFKIKRLIDSLVNEGFILQTDEFVYNNYGFSYTFSNKLLKLYDGFEIKKEEKPKEDLTPVIEVLKYLNKVRVKLNKREHSTDRIADSHKRFILSRLKDGATVEEMKAVIDLKEKEWLSDRKMNKYLRVETLFNKTKYNMYVGELPTTLNSNQEEIKTILRVLNVRFGRKGIKNEESDKLAKKLIELGYNDKKYLEMYLL